MQYISCLVQTPLNLHDLVCISWVLVLDDVTLQLRPGDTFVSGFFNPIWFKCAKVLKQTGEKRECYTWRILSIASDAPTQSISTHINMHVVFCNVYGICQELRNIILLYYILYTPIAAVSAFPHRKSTNEQTLFTHTFIHTNLHFARIDAVQEECAWQSSC